jgi:hypothetical protein
MFQRTEIDCPTLAEIGDRFRIAGEFASVFFRPAAPTASYPDFGRGFQAVLEDVLRSDFLREAVPGLVPIKVAAAMTFARLRRFEFEGSLVDVLLQGTCTEGVVGSEQEARESVRTILGRVLCPSGTVWAYRLDDPSWSALTDGATLAWSYFAYECSRKLWWFLSFADFY